jgi:GDP-4-dehydro-6-deoxy-D-mannose reductase
VRALVTGGRGFVGTWLTGYLSHCGDDVVAVDHEVDVTDAEAVGRTVAEVAPEAVYHLAALAHVGASWSDPGAALRVNAIGTVNLLEAAHRCDPRPIVLVTSSAEVYGHVPEERLPVTETCPLAPVTPYAVSKVAAEYAGIQAHLAHGLPVIRVRPFNHVGPGQSPGFMVAALARRIVEAQRSGATSVPVGNLTARRDLTDVRDVVRAYRALVERGDAGEVYNVCSGRDVAVSDVAQRLLRLSGADFELVTDPALVRPVDVPVVRGDPSRLEAVTGWRPEIELDVTLHDVLEHERAAQPA